jgi:hypothetical protein
MFLGNLIEGLHPTERLRSHLRIELRWMDSAFLLIQILVTRFFRQLEFKEANFSNLHDAGTCSSWADHVSGSVLHHCDAFCVPCDGLLIGHEVLWPGPHTTQVL